MNDKEVHIKPGNIKQLRAGEKVFESIHDWKLSEKELEKARRELGESDEKKEACLRKLKEKLSKNKNLKFRQDDFYLIRYLRAKKYDVSKAYESIKQLYELRKKNPDFFRVSSDMKSVQELNWTTCPIYTDEEGRILYVMTLNRWDPNETTYEDIFAATNNLCDITSMNPKCQINGVIGVYDTGGITLRHFSELLWNGRIFTTVTIMQNAFPWRIHKVLILNTNHLVRLLFNMLKPLFRRKIRERIILLGSDMNELHQYVNPVLLPKSLEGTLDEEELDISQHILDNLDYIKYERSFGYL